MRIVIGHYHLQTGGVTRVIEHAASALVAIGHQVLVVAGDVPQQRLPEGARFALVRALAYEERRPTVGPEALAGELKRAARKHFGGLPDLWHVHNHCLGKNLALPGALIALAEQGQPLLLQPHDFAEDGRPSLYARLLEHVGSGDASRLSTQLYPLAAHLHYAVLNDRDRGFLTAAGVAPERLHLLPNAVCLPARPEPSVCPFPDRRLWLYPTRAIRRKNLGELLLWSTLAEEQDLFATTQAPQNPAEQIRYARWVALAGELELPVEFSLGSRVDNFPALLASAAAMVTTSVAEGFGLAFLEPWLAGRPLFGRDLPEITRDFSEAGLDLSQLYERLDVPLDWLDRDRLLTAMQGTLRAVMTAYGRREAPADLKRLWGSAVRDEWIDFGRLDETAQEAVIRHLVAHGQDGASLRPPRLAGTATSDVVARNRAVAEHDYSIAGYGRRLERIYRALLEAPAEAGLEAADGSVLLDQFLAPERLFLLRS